MITIDDVATFVATLPGVVTGTKFRNRTWMIDDRGFAWQRPFSKADIKRYGDETPPAGDILAVRVANLDDKDALLALGLPGFFTIPHFNGYAAVLVQLKAARAADVRAAVVDAWRTVASPELQAGLVPHTRSARSTAKRAKKTRTVARRR